MIGGMLIIPMFMQNMSDFTAMESGVALLPGAVLMGLMSPVTGRIFDTVGAKWLAVIGFTLLTVATFMLAVHCPSTRRSSTSQRWTPFACWAPRW